MKIRTHAPRPQRTRGFSLVEILVGVAIGMVGMLVIFRTVATWDTHTRSTTSGSDAQNAGNLAMFNFERDIKQAGLGFMGVGDTLITPPTSLGCPVQFNDTGTARAGLFNMVPVEIGVGPLGAPDTITVFYGSSAFFVSKETFSLSTGTTKELARNNNAFKAGDLAIVANGLTCALIQVTDSPPLSKTVSHATGAYTDFYLGPAATPNARYNAAGGPAFALGGDIYSLGPQPRRNIWQINAARGVLTTQEYFQGNPAVEVAEGVVNIKAQYGLDTNGDRLVDTWTNVAPTTPVGWGQVLAVRVGMLVRSRQFERTVDPSAAGTPLGVTPDAKRPTWAGSSDPSGNGSFLMTNVDGTADSHSDNDPNPNNWRYYRYRVYEKEILLRNVLWGTSPGSTNIIGG